MGRKVKNRQTSGWEGKLIGLSESPGVLTGCLYKLQNSLRNQSHGSEDRQNTSLHSVTESQTE